jgi:hypothetical protein
MKRVLIARFYREAALPSFVGDALVFARGGQDSRGVTKKIRSPRQKPADVSHLAKTVAALAEAPKTHEHLAAGSDTPQTHETQSESHGLRGAAIRWTDIEDAVLRLAVRENRGPPDKRSQNGIRWAKIQRRAPEEYPALLRHLTSRGCKTLAKRYLQYLCPEEQSNKERVWR